MSSLAAFASIANVGWTWDAVAFVLLLFFALMYGAMVGRDRAIVVLSSVYLALAVVTNAPVLTLLGHWLRVEQQPTLRLVWFLGLFLLFFFLLWRSPLLKTLAREKRTRWQAALLSGLQMGLVLSIILFLLPVEWTASLSPSARQIFLSDFGRSFWLLAPLLLLAFLEARRSS